MQRPDEMPSDAIPEETKIDREELEMFLRHPGWRWLCEQIEARINASLNELLVPMTSETIYRSEFVKGQMKAWHDVAALPRLTYEEKLNAERGTRHEPSSSPDPRDLEWDRPV